MTDQTLADDIAYLRAAATAGASRPPLGGSLIASFGATFGLAAALSWATAWQALPGAIDSPAYRLAFVLIFCAPFAFLAGALMLTRWAATSGPARTGRIAILATAVLAAGLGARGLIDFGVKSGHAGLAAFAFLAAPVLFLVLAGLVLREVRRAPEAAALVNRVSGAGWTGAGLALVSVMLAMIALAWRTQANVLMLLPAVFWAFWGAGWWISGAAARQRWMQGVALASGALAVTCGLTLDLYATSTFGLFALAFLPGLKLVRDARPAA